MKTVLLQHGFFAYIGVGSEPVYAWKNGLLDESSLFEDDKDMKRNGSPRDKESRMRSLSFFCFLRL